MAKFYARCGSSGIQVLTKNYGKKVYDPGEISHEMLGVPALAGTLLLA
jgi:hypothetical protein